MKFRSLYILVVSTLLLSSPTTYAQLTVVPTHPASVLAAKLTGPGITVSSPVLTCAGVANGTFTSVTTPIMIDSGIILTTGRAINTSGTEAFLASNANGTPGDPALTALAGTTTYDACTLEFDFVPKGDTVSFNYQFGSEEYINSTCGQYNDAFAFFISGPGITGTQNMALVPGTSIPVTVNSINNGVPGPPGWPGFCNILNCTSMGPGSPFTSYYVNNAGGTMVTYRGYTTKLKAFHQVTPCSTYHLKMTIADAANSLYDSGVFIEAGSLTTNTYRFKKTDSIGHTINGIPNAFVKGCAPATITVLNSRVTSTTQTVYFSYGGTAVKGTDFAGPDSAIIAAGDTSVLISLAGIPTTPGGIKTVAIYLSSPFSCGVVDTVTLNLLDAPAASILTHDTAICYGSSFQVHVAGTPGLYYYWTPFTGVSSATIMEPVLSPGAATTYTLSATLPLSGCVPITRTIHVGINFASLSIVTPDTSICKGTSVPLLVTASPGLMFSWSPAGSLSNPGIQNPVATPSVTTTYSLAATSTIGGCPAFDQVTVTVVAPTVNIVTADTSICVGTVINTVVSGDPTYQYNWSPIDGLNDPTVLAPTITTTVPVTYYVTATVPGLLCTATDKISITLRPQVFASAKAAKSVCLEDPIELEAAPAGTNYSYQWTGPSGFSSLIRIPFIRSAHPENEGTYSVMVTNNTTGCVGYASTYEAVGTASTVLTDLTLSQTIRYGASIQLNAANAIHYTWTPNDGSLSDPNINNPVASPKEKTVYTVYGAGENGCSDTATVTIDVDISNDIFIPSAFSPNNDGRNDLFRLSGAGYHKLVEMSVFNRWGERVYHADNGANSGWDGTQNGMPCDLGTYHYLIILGNPDGTMANYKGNVTLVR